MANWFASGQLGLLTMLCLVWIICFSCLLGPTSTYAINIAEVFFLQGLTEDLKRAPDTLEDLKFVLRVIADIRDKSLDVELRYVDLQERYRTLLMYDIEVREKRIPPQHSVSVGKYRGWKNILKINPRLRFWKEYDFVCLKFNYF